MPIKTATPSVNSEIISDTRSPFIHSQAIVERGARIGPGTRVWAFAHILPGAVVGANCNICDHVFIENDVILGNHVTVKCGIYIWDGVRVDDLVLLGPNVVFTNDPAPRSKRRSAEFAKTYVGRGASIGANATILPGIVIGKWAMIGAGSVVTRNVPDFMLAVGNPARKVGYVCVCSKKLTVPQAPAEVSCDCGRVYQWAGATIAINGPDEADWIV